MRLKNRNAAIPNGFRCLMPQTGWNAQKLLPHRSFSDISRALLSHMQGNRFVFQQAGIEISIQSAEGLIEQQSVKAMLAEGHTSFVQMDAPESFQLPPANPVLRQNPGAVAGAGAVNAFRKAVAGVGVLRQWLGAGLKPVDKPLAEKRAKICVTCEKNGQPGWLQKLTGAVATEVLALISMKEDLALETSVDSKLNMCTACDCKLILKVHTPLEHILKETSPEIMQSLPEWCWIKKRDA